MPHHIGFRLTQHCQRPVSDAARKDTGPTAASTSHVMPAGTLASGSQNAPMQAYPLCPAETPPAPQTLSAFDLLGLAEDR